MEDPKPSDDVIVENPPVNEPVASEQEPQVAEEPQQEQVEEVHEEPKERPIQNREAEWQRKYENLVTQLPTMIGQELQKHIPNQQKAEPEYSIEELEEFALKNPNYRPYVEKKKLEIQQKSIAKLIEDKWEQKEKTVQSNMLRQQAENEVLNNAKYSEAFVTLPNGQKTWNNDSKLAQTIGLYMQDPDLQKRPDGLRIASKLAYADLLESGELQAKKKLESVKRQNQVLKSKVMPEGGGVPVVPKSKDPYSSSVERLRQTGRMEDAEVAVSAYLSNLLKKD